MLTQGSVTGAKSRHCEGSRLPKRCISMFILKRPVSLICTLNTHTHRPQEQEAESAPAAPTPGKQTPGTALPQTGQRLQQLSFERNCEWEMPGAQEPPLQHREASGQ